MLAELLGGTSRVFDAKTSPLVRAYLPVERALCRFAGVKPDESMTWQRYVGALLIFNVVGLVFVYAMQRLQGVLPLNPQQLPAVPARVAINTAVSSACKGSKRRSSRSRMTSCC